MEADSDRQDQNVWKILKAVTIPGSASLNPIYCEGQLLKKFKYENVIKMKNKPYPALLGGSYLFNEIKKRMPKSRETIPLIDPRLRLVHQKMVLKNPWRTYVRVLAHPNLQCRQYPIGRYVEKNL
jgi:hypothetical protein